MAGSPNVFVNDRRVIREGDHPHEESGALASLLSQIQSILDRISGIESVNEQQTEQIGSFQVSLQDFIDSISNGGSLIDIATQVTNLQTSITNLVNDLASEAGLANYPALLTMQLNIENAVNQSQAVLNTVNSIIDDIQAVLALDLTQIVEDMNTALSEAQLAQQAAESAASQAIAGATNAQTHSTGAATSATNAAASASAASTYATLASTYADDALSYSNASQTARIAAESARDAAAVSSNTAATHATSAYNSAISAQNYLSDTISYAGAAAASALTANLSREDAVRAMGNSDFTFDDTNWTLTPVNSWTFQSIGTPEEKALQSNAGAKVVVLSDTIYNVPYHSSVMTVTAKIRQTVDGVGNAPGKVFVGFACYDSGGAYLGDKWAATTILGHMLTNADGWHIYVGNIVGTGASATTYFTGTAKVRLKIILNETEVGLVEQQIDYAYIQDATLATQAADSASAASTYASNAAASQTEAGNYATAAQNSAVQAATSATGAANSEGIATTRASEASVSATSAATSASDAEESASQAATSATTAANSATAAGNSANAAATSATNAQTYATDAETYSTASQNFSIVAQTAADDAATSESNAAISASQAATSATTAAGSASTATTQAGIATSAAGTATTEADNASTSATNASVSASQAANSATNAAASASTATTQAGIATSAATDATTQAGIATTQASNASVSASQAATSATNASNSASSASTSASTAAGSATSAGNSANAAATSASQAATYSTNAGNSASTATTQAGIATTAATDALDSATDAASSASSASVSANNAATSATNAAGSDSSAMTQAGIATTAATNAATSATDATNVSNLLLYGTGDFDFRYSGKGWSTGYAANTTPATEPLLMPNINGTTVTAVSGSQFLNGNGLQVTADLLVANKMYYAIDTTRRYTFKWRFRKTVNNTVGTSTLNMGLIYYNSNKQYITHSNCFFNALAFNVATGWVTGEVVITGEDAAPSTSIPKFKTGTKYIRVFFQPNNTGGDATHEFDIVGYDDTELVEQAKDLVTQASASAAAAAISASQAATSETNAAGSASSASTQAGIATSAAGTATTQAGIATTQATNASVSATNAASSATSASASASTASTQAGIATTAATNAGNSATSANISATNAATSATNAANSASTASTQASIATSAALDASQLTIQLFPNSFNNSKDAWTDSQTGSPSSVVTTTKSIVVNPTVGNALQFSGVGAAVYSKGVLSSVVGNVYEIEVEGIFTTNTTDGTGNIRIVLAGLDSNYSTSVNSAIYEVSTNMNVAGGAFKVSARFSDTANATYNILAWATGKIWHRVSIILNTGEAGTPVVAIKTITIRDITSVIRAAEHSANALVYANQSAASATTAAGSASTATTQAGIATTAATTSTTQAGIATTQAGNASTSASQAATSATNAAGSATSASNSATTAANSATTSTNQAGIATTQASNASVSASNAATSASAANSSAAAAAASQTVAARISSGPSLNKNPLFANWSGTYPDDHTIWDITGGTIAKNTANARYGPNCIYANATSTGNLGTIQINSQILPLKETHYVIDVEAELVSGSWSGAGIYVVWYNGGTITGSLIRSFTLHGTIEDTTGRFKGVYEIPAGAYSSPLTNMRFYMMTNWASFGASTPSIKELRWHKAILRPATTEEIRTYNVASEISAAVTTESAARIAADGAIEAKYGVKVDVNGYVSGFGLISTANNAVPTSEFTVLADKFRVVKPGGPGNSATPKQMFSVGLVNGTNTLVLNGDLIADGTLRGNALAIGAAQNMIENSDLLAGTMGYSLLQYGGTEHQPLSLRTDAYGIMPLGSLQLYQAGTTAGNYADLHIIDTDTATFKYYNIEAGKRYQFSVYTYAHRSNCQLYIQWLQPDGTHISYSATSQFSPQNANPGQQLANYARRFLFATAPSNAGLARIFIRKHGTISLTTSYLWVYKPFFGEALLNQTEPSPWGPAGITLVSGGHIKTGAVDARHITALKIDAQEILQNGTLITDLIAANAVSNSVSASSATGLALVTTSTTVQTVSVIFGSGKIFLHGGFAISFADPIATSSTGWYDRYITIEMYCDSDLIYTTKAFQVGYASYQYKDWNGNNATRYGNLIGSTVYSFATLHTPTAGSHTYSIKAYTDTSSSYVINMVNRYLVAHNVKK